MNTGFSPQWSLTLASLAGLAMAGQNLPQDHAQAQEQAWGKLKALAGQWHGKGKGKPGTSTIDRSYESILEDQFIMSRNVSVFAATNTDRKNERHADMGIFSFDKTRKCVVLRQFHTEGFVNRYVLESIEDGGNSLTFVTESVENGPAGLRARLTIRLQGDTSIQERFDLAWPGKDFETCVQTSLSR